MGCEGRLGVWKQSVKAEVRNRVWSTLKGDEASKAGWWQFEDFEFQAGLARLYDVGQHLPNRALQKLQVIMQASYKEESIFSK